MALHRGARIPVAIERPAAGGRMIARHEGAVLLVSGAIPGERVEVAVEQVRRQTVWATTVRVLEPSPDRVAEADPSPCGGHVYAHVAAARQAALKSEIIADAFRRIGKLTLGAPVEMTTASHDGYRMRARLHLAGGRVGFYREGSHTVCDPGPTRQLLPATLTCLEQLRPALVQAGVTSIELTETCDGSARALHCEGGRAPRLSDARGGDGLQGLSWAADPAGRTRSVMGTPWVTDAMALGHGPVVLQRHARAFFQGNRFLLQPLVSHVLAAIPDGPMLDLYAGVGLFSAAAAAAGHEGVAVEADPVSAADLAVNAAPWGGRLDVRHAPVESVLATGIAPASCVVLDPPRTGASPEALDGILALAAPRVVYVSCDMATLARDAARLTAGGYALSTIRGFDLFPQTAHVEAVAVFERG